MLLIRVYIISEVGIWCLLVPGMQMFFKTHKCGWLCKKLGLKDIGEYKEPTTRCHIPGGPLLSAGVIIPPNYD